MSSRGEQNSGAGWEDEDMAGSEDREEYFSVEDADLEAGERQGQQEVEGTRRLRQGLQFLEEPPRRGLQIVEEPPRWGVPVLEEPQSDDEERLEGPNRSWRDEMMNAGSEGEEEEEEVEGMEEELVDSWQRKRMITELLILIHDETMMTTQAHSARDYFGVHRATLEM